MLYHDINNVNVENKIKVLFYQSRTKNCNFQLIFSNSNISINNGENLIKFGTLVVGGHSEGTVSQILYLGPSFYFMKSRKLGCKKHQKASRFLT